MKSPQFWSLILCLCATIFVIHIRGDVDKVPPSAPLAGMPATFGPWISQDIAISQEALEVLGKGDFLNRIYTQPASTVSGQGSGVPPVQLFIAYFATQRSGQSIHSPQNCLPGSGWTFVTSGTTTFIDRTGKSYRVGDYVIANGRDKEEVFYWYQSHGRSIASDYAAKLLMLTDAIRYGRTDAALVRLITEIPSNQSTDVAHARLVDFAQKVTPLLPAYVPN